MTTKERLKKEIDNMPEDLIAEVDKFISSIKNNTERKQVLHTFKLSGNFDDLNIRAKAYE